MKEAFMERSLKQAITAGVIAGIIWGWVAMAANSVTGIFPFESTFAHNIVSFTFGGAVFGVVAGGLMAAAGHILPLKRTLPRALFVCASLWVLLRLGGTVLSSMDPHRYHVFTPEIAQGFALALVLGTLLGLTWKRVG